MVNRQTLTPGVPASTHIRMPRRMIALFCSVSLLFLCVVLGVRVTGAEAAANVGAPPLAGPTGLPDGRLYEEVTPAYKNGNFYDTSFTFGLASADGNAVVYPMSGAVGTSYAGAITEYVSHRTPGMGWQTTSTTPRPESTNFSPFSGTVGMVPSSDFDRFLFTSQLAFVAAEPKHETGINSGSSVNIYLSEDPAIEPAWIGEPQMTNPIPMPGNVVLGSYVVAGVSPSLETVYFTYEGTLTPEDASREANVALGPNRQGDPWGFYEWNNGRLRSAGVLPNGTVSPFGAVPAAIAGEPDSNRTHHSTQVEGLDNEVSQDGSRAFFVSPDPNSTSSEPPELYVREATLGGEHVSVLVSASKLAGHEGEAALHGVVSTLNTPAELKGKGGTYAFASPDGSQVFFASEDRLTTTAPENVEVKEYDYDIDTDNLTYLPSLTGPIVVSTTDGSEVLFENRASSPWELELWRDGVNGGSVTKVAELPERVTVEVPELPLSVSAPDVNEAHASTDGSVFVFRTDAPLAGFNAEHGAEQVYRYDVANNVLDCLSCPPVGTPVGGNARMSYNNAEAGVKANGSNSDPSTTIETRGMSADGSRVFFDTPSALVPQDTNGVRDVYEWEDGKVYLVSSETSSVPSEYLDNSESGGDVFFASTQGLVPGDVDESGDVYDARIPRVGDNPPPAEVPCKGSVCQGPPSVPQLLGPAASETFSGAGNVTPAVEVKPKAKPKKKAKAKKRSKKKVKAGKTKKVSRSSKRVKHGKRRGN